jgi:hypothetical protein
MTQSDVRFWGKGDPRRPFPECLLVTLTGTPALQSHSLEASSGETTTLLWRAKAAAV